VGLAHGAVLGGRSPNVKMDCAYAAEMNSSTRRNSNSTTLTQTDATTWRTSNLYTVTAISKSRPDRLRRGDVSDGERLADSSDKLEPDTVKVVSTGSNGAGGQ
jgi:hypothetical protein